MIQAAVFPAMTLICPEKSAKYTGMQQVFMSSGSVLAPLLLSYLLGSQLNLHWRVHYIIILVMSCLVFLGLLCSRPSVTRYVAVEQEGAVAVPARKVLFTLPFLLVLFASALYMNMETGFMNYAREFYEVSGVGGQAGIAISLIWGSMVVSRFITSRLGRGRGVLLVCSFSLAGVALALMILLPIRGWCSSGRCCSAGGRAGLADDSGHWARSFSRAGGAAFQRQYDVYKRRQHVRRICRGRGIGLAGHADGHLGGSGFCGCGRGCRRRGTWHCPAQAGG